MAFSNDKADEIPWVERLRADCSRCFGLCCVATAFAASADFAIDKRAGQACPHLDSEFRCAIHAHLRQRGFRGCAVYDCFGAGQHVSQVTFGGMDWRQRPELAQQMFQVFGIVRQLHELLWHLDLARRLQLRGPLANDVLQAFNATWRLTQASPQVLLECDVASHWQQANVVLRRVSEEMRSNVRQPTAEYAAAELLRANLRSKDLSGANFRAARLIGASLRGSRLYLADLTGADLRDADLRGADLSRCLFLTQSQVDSARGDATTQLPPGLTRPAHWSRAAFRN